jgi:hypothetical protein
VAAPQRKRFSSGAPKIAAARLADGMADEEEELMEMAGFSCGT